MDRRFYLLASATSLSAFLAGCSGEGGDDGSDDSGGNGDGNESNSGNESEGNENESENDSSEEETQNTADVPQGEDVLENAGLVIQEHELVEGDYEANVEGIVENTTDEEKGYVEVRVRGYDADGNQLDSYLDNTQDLAGGGTWAFAVPIFDYEDLEEYDIQVNDQPF